MMTRESLRTALAKADRSGAGRPYPLEVRRLVVSYVEARRREGVTRADAARELGVSAESVVRWSVRSTSGEVSGFHPVRIMSPVERIADAVAEQGRVVVHGPCGLRIEGLDLAGIAELLRSLS